MGRPRQHGEGTRESLLAAAEQLVAQGGIDAVGVRPVAKLAGTSTRAVYALFGSKEELVQALAARTFRLLQEQVASVPLSHDVGEDLVQGAVRGFRVFAIEHPDLFRLFFSATTIRGFFEEEAASAQMAAWQQLIQRVERAHAAGVLGTHSAQEVTLLWDVMCCGLALRELCGRLDPGVAEQTWTEGLRALLYGLQQSARDGRRRHLAASATGNYS